MSRNADTETCDIKVMRTYDARQTLVSSLGFPSLLFSVVFWSYFDLYTYRYLYSNLDTHGSFQNTERT